jgi:transitional endoplasmic reticulum ATPase
MTIRYNRTRIRRRVELAANSNDQLNLWVLKCLEIEGLCEQLVMSCEATGVLQSVGIWINEQLGERRQIVKAEQAVRARLATLLVADRSHPVFLNVELLGDLLQVDATSREILAMSVMCDDRHALDMCMTQLGRLADGNVTRYFQLLADVIGHPVDAVRAALGPDSVLRRAGLLTFSPARMKDQENPLDVSGLARTLLAVEHTDARALVGGLVEPAATAELTLADYAHLAVDVADLHAYLCGALVAKRRGVNVLLYGKPGTGKTQLARALARDLGVTLYQVRVAGDGGLALPRHERFSSFQLCQALLQDRADVLVLFDEVEDAFPSALLQAFGEEPSKEKGWVNRLLEDNPVPAFWLTNQVQEIDAAFIRRFDIVLEVPVPPRKVRRQMLAKEVHGLAVSERWLDRCAADPDITPADIARVARVAREISSSDPEATLTRLLDRHLLVRRGPKAPVYRLGPIDYDLSYVNVDID